MVRCWTRAKASSRAMAAKAYSSSASPPREGCGADDCWHDGVSLTRFALVNVGSAFVWAAAHLLPAIALWRGFQVVHAANPRFAVLAGLGVAGGVLGWASMRLARGILIPAADRDRLKLAALLENRSHPGVALARVLRNLEGALEAAALIGLAICALTGFGLLLAAVVFDPEKERGVGRQK